MYLFIKEVEFCGHCLREGVTKPLPGRLLSLEKWELPKTITALRSFLGFCNYYAGYVHNFSSLTTPILEKLKVGKLDGKKGSKLKLVWEQNEIQAFELVKKALLAELSLQLVDPNKPFILRVDSSGYAVGAVLEQTARTSGMPTVQDAFSGKTTPVAFMSANCPHRRSELGT